jgi:DNA-binding CsgD family transcriptional regulator
MFVESLSDLSSSIISRRPIGLDRLMGSVDFPEPRQTRGLVGRGAELELIRVFLDRAQADGEALLLFGEPGVGKTLLLDAAAEVASSAGTKVLRAGGVEFEADVPYAGLHQLLLPLHEEFAGLDPAERDALNIALGFGLGPAPDRLVLYNATLSLLRRATSRTPLLLVVDDVPWLDRATTLLLGFVARRLAGSRVGFFAASRSGSESFFERTGLPELELGPLDGQAASDLLTANFPALAPAVRERLLAEAQGNPLALLELPATLTNAQRAAFETLPTALPLNRRLRTLFASRITELPDRTRHLLLLMALDGTGDPRVLEKTTPRGPRAEDLALAEQRRLAYVTESTHRLSFRHPLIRSTVVELASSDERRRAHHELAQIWTDQVDRRAWHLGHATVEPNEEVAKLLEHAAHHVLRRGDSVGAVNALIRASELSPAIRDRTQRLSNAAYIGADVTGELRSASQLLARARRTDPELKGSLQAAVAASAVLLNADGDVDTAHRLLVGAIKSRPGSTEPGDTAMEDALHTLMLICNFGGRAELWKPFYDAIGQFGPRVPETLHLSSKTFADPARMTPAAIEQLDAAVEGLADEVDPTRIVRIAIAGFFVHRLAGCRDALGRVVSDARGGGAVASGINALILLGFDCMWTGEWDRADQLVDEALELCESHGYRLLAWPGHLVKAVLAAVRGEYDITSRLAEQMIRWAVPRRARQLQWFAWQAQALAALGTGDFEEAYQHASAISPAGTFAPHVQHALHVPMDLVEAAVHTGRRAEAAAHVAAMREAGFAALSPRLALLTSGSAAMAAADETSVELFKEALAIPGSDCWPFDLARLQLAYGERLRRVGPPTQSRVQLRSALETFERLGARPWANRAATELRATGQTKPRNGGFPREGLTPQEREIAMLAASGLSNKQIGQRLYLSHRTVGAHLYRVFPKLGVTSRAGLRDALDSLPAEQSRNDHSG